jgi:hypothetical protein
MAATSITTTQAPSVCNPVLITNIPPPGPTLWVVTTRGYIKPYSQVPLANAPRLLNQPRHPPTTPRPLQCHLATMDRSSLLLPAAGALARMQLPPNAPRTFPLPNQEYPRWQIPWSSTMGSTNLAPCPHLLHMVSPLLVRVSTRTTSDGQGWSMAYIN